MSSLRARASATWPSLIHTPPGKLGKVLFWGVDTLFLAQSQDSKLQDRHHHKTDIIYKVFTKRGWVNIILNDHRRNTRIAAANSEIARHVRCSMWHLFIRWWVGRIRCRKKMLILEMLHTVPLCNRITNPSIKFDYVENIIFGASSIFSCFKDLKLWQFIFDFDPWRNSGVFTCTDCMVMVMRWDCFYIRTLCFPLPSSFLWRAFLRDSLMFTEIPTLPIFNIMM